MSRNVLSHLEFSKRTAKRAQYEAFEFSIVGANIRVRNASHANPDEHEYVVTVEDGVPVTCECPADEFYEGACKHRVAVAIRAPLLDAVNNRQIATDGGTQQDTSSEAETDCDCEKLRDGFPCWACVEAGRKSLPQND